MNEQLLEGLNVSDRLADRSAKVAPAGGDRPEADYAHLFRTLFEQSADAVFLIGTDGDANGRILDANPAAAAMHGYAPEELTSTFIHELEVHNDPGGTADRLQRLHHGEWIASDIVHRRRDGNLFTVRFKAGLVTLGGKNVILGIATEKIRAAALDEQLHLLQSLIDTLPQPIYYKDTDGRYLGCNAAFEAFVQQKKEALIGRTIYDIEAAQIAEWVSAADRELFATGKPQIYEGQLKSSDASPRMVIFNKALFRRRDGSVGGLVGGIIDITALKRAEQEKALLAAAIQQTPEMVIMTDLSGKIHYVNPAFEQITGYRREEVLGQSPALLRSGKHPEAFYRKLWEELGARKIWKGRLINRRKNGTLFEVEATLVPVQREEGQVTDYLAVERDISREIERERQLRQAQKMEAIGTLAGGIAHDFNNILSAIIGFTEIALYDLPPAAGTRAYLKKVLTAGERARGLVNQILAFSRATEQEARPIQINSIAKEAIKLLKATLPSTITITARIESEATILADPTQIHQVLMNLCTNAAHAMQNDGGELIVEMTPLTLASSGLRRPPQLPEGVYVRLIIQDTGCGMAPEIMDRIFDPFFTTKKQGEGTGMGLSVVHGIVEACGGAINVRSAIGEGSTFEILLPVIEPLQGIVPAPEPPLCAGSERILFVDDEIFQVELGEQMLQRLGYRVTAVSDSGRALALFRQAPQQFDVVVTDMTMPGITGDELARQIKMIRPQIPVIICTGYSQKLSQASAESIGVAGIAYKPLIMKELAGLIRAALDKDRA
jgi:PAS domain S-box-containing protein